MSCCIRTLSCLVLVTCVAYAQGTGNFRDVVLKSSVSGSVLNDASKPLRSGDLLELQVESPGSSLLGLPFMIFLDFRLPTDHSVFQIPNEPDVLGIGPAMMFLADGTGTLPALIPGFFTVGYTNTPIQILVPDLNAIWPGVSAWMQACTIDALAPNGIAFTSAVRHDSNLFTTSATYDDPTAGSSALYGYRVLSGDVDGDGFEDLLVGVTQGDPGGVTNAGWVEIRYGPSLTATTTLMAPTPTAGALFGTALLFSDVTGDGVDDIVVGARAETQSGILGAGAVYVFEGPSYQVVNRLGAVSPFVNGRFGHDLASTDWNADGVLDLVVAAPGQTSGGIATAGQVYVFPSPGFSTPVVIENPLPQYSSKFGYRVIGADFDNDGTGDLVIAEPFYDQGVSNDNSGALHLYRGGQTLPESSWYHALDQDALMGDDLAVGDLNGDGLPDLIAGAEFADVSLPDQGLVYLRFGPNLTTEQVVASPDAASAAGFGSGVAVADVNRDGYPDLVVGEFQAATTPQTPMAGRAWVLVGPAFDTSMEFVPPSQVAGDLAGRRVACGDFDDSGFANPVLAAPFATPPGSPSLGGGVYVFR